MYTDENSSYRENEGGTGHAFLTEDSVVLITGAAGFLGSELALALHRTYSPKRIICVDRMGDRPESQEELALFEFQRQRSFNVMQTLGDKGRFYRADFSPMIPEYYDMGEVPVLDHIFRENLDISHVVHLADPFPHSALQAVPREMEVPKAGMMESLLEQLAKHEREGRSKVSGDDNSDEYNPPNFVYASSYEVYPHQESKTDPMHHLLEEGQTLSTPSSLRGASKMMDEMIAKLYYDTKGIYSVGLRFFSVYGPWGVPGSPLFEMAERAVAGDLDSLDIQHEKYNFHSGLNGIDIADNNDNDGDDDGEDERSFNQSWKKKIHDFVYIDDAVDAIMAAMQFRSAPSPSESKEGNSSGERQINPHPIIFNVASGEGHSLEDVLEVMQEFFPPEGKKNSSASSSSTTNELIGTIGSTKRAESLLGYQPQVSLHEGIIKMLAWHYDRTFPYGGIGPKDDRQKNVAGGNNGGEEKVNVVTQQGMAGCLQFDKECLRGTPAFPCASECSHKSQCTKSYYDEVIALTQKLTSSCETVLYTVDLDDSLTSLPSARPKFQTSKSFLKGTCNLAFVSHQSLLIQNKQGESPFMGGGSSGRDGQLYRDGSWVLIPLKVIPLHTAGADSGDSRNGVDQNEILMLLPKLSPGLFFGSKSTKRAIYIDPNIVIDNISKLLLESYAQPYSDKMEGATAMLIGRGTPKDYFANDDDDEEEIILKLQDPNYQHQNLESTNTLVQNAAYRMVKIAVSDNLFGDGFMELLDSRWIVHGLQSDDGRLFRCDVLGEIVQWEVSSDRSALEFILGLHDMWSRVIAKASGAGPWWIGDNVVTIPEAQHQPVGRRRLQEDGDEVVVVESTDQSSREANEGAPQTEEENDEPNENTADDDEIEEHSQEQNHEDNSGEGKEKDRGEFVADAIAQKEVVAGDEKLGDSSDEVREEDRPADDKNKKENDEHESQHRDFSSFDTWMGILSSSRIKYFVRIVPSSEVGITSIDS